MITSSRSQVTRSVVLCFVCKCGHICDGCHPLRDQLHPWPVLGPGNSSVPHHQLGSNCCYTPPPQTNCYCCCCSQTVKLVSSSLKQQHHTTPSLLLGPSITLHGRSHHLRDEDQDPAEITTLEHSPSRHSHSPPHHRHCPLRSAHQSLLTPPVQFCTARPGQHRDGCTVHCTHITLYRTGTVGRQTGRLPRTQTNTLTLFPPPLLSLQPSAAQL